MNPVETLKNLGLDEKEIAIYLSLLELGEATVLEIAKHSRVKRPTVYVLLGPLEEKGFISRVIHGKKVLYTVQHPQKLVTEAELQLKELKNTMPQFEALFHKEEGKPRVIMYEGKEKLDRAFDELFVVKGDAMFMDTLALSQEVFPRTFKKSDYAKLSPDFRIFELLDESEESRDYAKRVRGPYREVRFFNKDLLPFEASIGIFGNRTLITSVKKEFFTISIESKEIAKAFKSIFSVMWAAAKE